MVTSSVHGNPKVEKKTPKCGLMSTLTVRRCRARAGGVSRRELAFHRHASDFHNFYVETSQTFTIRRPRIGLNFKFKLRKSSCSSPPASPRQRCSFACGHASRAPHRAAAPHQTPQNTCYMLVYWHSSFVSPGRCRFAHCCRRTMSWRPIPTALARVVAKVTLSKP